MASSKARSVCLPGILWVLRLRTEQRALARLIRLVGVVRVLGMSAGQAALLDHRRKMPFGQVIRTYSKKGPDLHRAKGSPGTEPLDNGSERSLARSVTQSLNRGRQLVR